MPRMFQVRGQIPGMNPQARVRGVNAPPGSMNAPVFVRNRLGGLPGPNGDAGNWVYPYTEQGFWGDGAQGSNLPGLPPPIGQPPPALTPQQQSVISTPYGQSDRPWTNPCTYAGFPIPSAGGQILSGNYNRNSLIIQNTSTATAPDIAPTLYIGFNSQAGQGLGSLALPPGLGFFWGASDPPPRDSIFATFIGASGASVVIAGAAIQGTYAPT
jgi:hypothetical protein